ncbi:MAG: dipeptide epimerase [Candidatus Omnitrophica bacterium]|nr:dipeptide epimerase [Candidatus Omnitrophota bacterium]MBU4488452.1 dipeptide epimerase [Candidatus Omnitrophota bacterium]MCG2705648.1 dipeptide epimerase [Candidatus Omnitrophota bacterium]
MQFKVSKIDIYAVDIPFRMKFGHASKSRKSSESIFVKAESENGVSGFGESLPRRYVTGEDQSSVIDSLKTLLPGALLGKTFDSFGDVVDFCGSSFGDLKGASCAAIELALLDLAGRVFKCSVSKALGAVLVNDLRYSAAIGSVPPLKAGISALKFKLYGFKDIKIKVGDDRDIGRLKVVRALGGRDINLRLDANCTWGADEAIERLSAMRRYNFSLIEQPVKKGDIASLKKVSNAIREPVMADESLCTLDDAKKLIEEKACKMFNIRISKCGGLINSLNIAKLAQESGISYQLGCQVGESGVLSAAGRHFASCVKGIKYLEGSYAKFLLLEDVIKEDVGFGYGGRAGLLCGNGLGITVDEPRLKKYVTNEAIIK